MQGLGSSNTRTELPIPFQSTTETNTRRTEKQLSFPSPLMHVCDIFMTMCVTWRRWVENTCKNEWTVRLVWQTCSQTIWAKIHPSIREGKTFNLIFFFCSSLQLPVSQSSERSTHRERRETDRQDPEPASPSPADLAPVCKRSSLGGCSSPGGALAAEWDQ